MKFTFVPMALALLTFAAFSSEATRVVCEPNLKIHRSCNQCVCSTDGSSLSCTTNICPPDYPPVVISPDMTGVVAGENVVCTAGESFPVLCNKCKCNTEGTEIGCTRRFCRPFEQQ